MSARVARAVRGAFRTWIFFQVGEGDVRMVQRFEDAIARRLRRNMQAAAAIKANAREP